MVAQVVQDLRGQITMPCYTSGDRVKITMDLLEKVKPLSYFLNTKKFLCGSEVTYVDFIMFELCDLMEWLSQSLFFERYPEFEQYHKRISELPRLAEFYSDDDKCIKRPFNNKSARLNN